MRSLFRSHDGQATVELALALPILIWVLIGLVDVARMANASLMIQHAAREAVRVGITGATDAQVSQRARDMAPTLDASNLVVSVTPAGTRASGTDVTVTITYNYTVLTLMGIIGNRVPLQVALTARVE